MKKLLAALVVAAIAVPAAAVPVTLSFTASHFGTGIFDGSQSIENAISGSFTWEAATATSPIDHLVSVSLTIGGHNYDLSEIGFQPYSTGYVLGANVNGVGVTRIGSNDFYLVYTDPTTPVTMAYASAGSPNGTWVTRTFDSFSIDAADDVPEPAMLGLFGLGAIGLVASRRRKS